MSILGLPNISLFTVRFPNHTPFNPQYLPIPLTNHTCQVPAAFGLCLLPHLYAVGSAGFTVYDNSNPRAYRDTLMRDTSIPKVVRTCRFWGISYLSHTHVLRLAFPLRFSLAFHCYSPFASVCCLSFKFPSPSHLGSFCISTPRPLPNALRLPCKVHRVPKSIRSINAHSP